MEGNGIEGRLTVVFDRPLVSKAVFSGDQGTMTVTPLHWLKQYTIRTEKQRYTETMPYDGDDFCGQVMHFDAPVDRGRKESPIMSLQDSLTCAHICEKIRDTFMH